MPKNFTLVTGAAGFIGSRLTSELLNKGKNVLAIDCFLPDLYSAEIKLQRWGKLNSTNLVKLNFDLRTDDFSNLLDYNIDSIINEAAMPGLSSNWNNFAPYYECNLGALNRLLEFAKTQNIRSFIQASTSSVYGKNAIGNEDENLNPNSPYGVSKLAAEKLLLAYNEWYEVPVKILRYFSVYGPNQRPDMAYAKIINALYSGLEFTVYGDGEQLRSNTYIDDIVNATILADEHESKLLIMNICGDEVVSLNNAIMILEKLTGEKLVRLNMPGRIGDQRNTSGNNLKAKELLGWKSKVGIEIGLQNQVEAFKNTASKP
jgi:UDP-glucuronate 4-epimerase